MCHNRVILGGNCHLITLYQKQKTKGICQISGLKSGRSWLRNQTSGCLRESFWKSIWVRNKTVIYKVVAYERKLLREVVAMRDRVDCGMIFFQDTLFDLFFILDSGPACSFTITPCTKVVLLQSCVTRSVRIFVNVNVAGRLCKVLLNSFSDIHF